MDRHTSRRGQLAIAAAAVGYGVDTALSVAALHGLRPADLLMIELGGSAAILLAVAGATGKLRRQGAGRGLAQGAVLPGLSFLLGNLGLARTTATSGALLLSVDTVATVLLAALILRERIGVAAGTAVGLGTVGTALVALYAPDAGSTAVAGSETLGNLLVLASVIGSAGYVVWSRRTAEPDGEGDSIGRTAWQFLGAVLAVLPFIIGSWWTGGSRIATAGPGTCRVPKLRHGALPATLCCRVVLADEPAQDRSRPDPAMNHRGKRRCRRGADHPARRARNVPHRGRRPHGRRRPRRHQPRRDHAGMTAART